MPAPMFSRRHYIVVAGLIRAAGYLAPDARGQLIDELCECFAADNERFQPDRFREAAGQRRDGLPAPL